MLSMSVSSRPPVTQCTQKNWAEQTKAHYGNNKPGHVLSSHLALVALEKCVSRYSMAFLVAKTLEQQSRHSQPIHWGPFRQSFVRSDIIYFFSYCSSYNKNQIRKKYNVVYLILLILLLMKYLSTNTSTWIIIWKEIH